MESKKRKAEESGSEEAQNEEEAYEQEDEEDDECEDEVKGGKEEEAAAANDDVEKADNGDAESEKVRFLIGPFSKEKLIDLVETLACEDPSILPRIEKFADKDITHRKLFVRGLGGEISSDEVKDVFLKFGEIEECTIIQEKQTGRSRGYGFVTYKQRDSAQQALKNPTKKIRGRTTWCQLAAGGPTTTAQGTSADDPALRKIYVGNVPVDLSADKIVKFFSQYGAIEEGPLGMTKRLESLRDLLSLSIRLSIVQRRLSRSLGSLFMGIRCIVNWHWKVKSRKPVLLCIRAVETWLHHMLLG